MREKNEYVKLWLSYASYFEAYGAAEVGRLVLAMIEYKSSGATPEFSGSERFIWPAIKRDIDESNKAQENKAVANRENGKKGGRPKKATGFEETEETEEVSEKPKKAMDKGQGKGQRSRSKDMDMDISTASARDDALAVVARAYMDRINPTPSPTSMELLGGYVEAMGQDVCLRAIDKAIDAGKPVWNYVHGILRRLEAQGVKCLADMEALDEKHRAADKQARGAGGPVDGPGVSVDDMDRMIQAAQWAKTGGDGDE